MKYGKWQPKQRLERKYESLLMALFKPFMKEIKKANGNVDKIAEILENASNSKVFSRKSKLIAKKMSTLLWIENAKNWREAARRSSRGQEVYESLRKEMNNPILKARFDELMDYNATLIKTLPLSISKDVIKHIHSKGLTSQRASETAEEIQKYFPKHTRAKAQLISRTETSKISSALTQVRAESLGINWAVWRTSEDARVRNTHSIMEGVLFDFKHKPSPEKLDKRYKGKSYGEYGPGEIFNCRCYPEPLTDYSDVRWPHKVYNWKTKRIETMTLVKFKEKMEGQNVKHNERNK